MGTRNLIAVQVDGEYKVAQYGQWDGYPSGQGVDILNFLREFDLGVFVEKVRATVWLDKDVIQERWVECGADDSGWVGSDVSDKFDKFWPELSRGFGSKILAFIWASAPGVGLCSHIEFTSNGLFCEWAYVIDFDKGVLEVYEGFGEEPLDPSERFADSPIEPCGETQYYPVRLIASFPLDELPTDVEFIAACVTDEEEAE